LSIASAASSLSQYRANVNALSRDKGKLEEGPEQARTWLNSCAIRLKVPYLRNIGTAQWGVGVGKDTALAPYLSIGNDGYIPRVQKSTRRFEQQQ
jgi:hypothetical protein